MIIKGTDVGKTKMKSKKAGTRRNIKIATNE